MAPFRVTKEIKRGPQGASKSVKEVPHLTTDEVVVALGIERSTVIRGLRALGENIPRGRRGRTAPRLISEGTLDELAKKLSLPPLNVNEEAWRKTVFSGGTTIIIGVKRIP